MACARLSNRLALERKWRAKGNILFLPRAFLIPPLSFSLTHLYTALVYIITMLAPEQSMGFVPAPG